MWSHACAVIKLTRMHMAMGLDEKDEAPFKLKPNKDSAKLGSVLREETLNVKVISQYM